MKNTLPLRNHPLLHRKRQRIVVLTDNVRARDLAIGRIRDWHS